MADTDPATFTHGVFFYKATNPRCIKINDILKECPELESDLQIIDATKLSPQDRAQKYPYLRCVPTVYDFGIPPDRNFETSEWDRPERIYEGDHAIRYIMARASVTVGTLDMANITKSKVGSNVSGMIINDSEDGFFIGEDGQVQNAPDEALETIVDPYNTGGGHTKLGEQIPLSTVTGGDASVASFANVGRGAFADTNQRLAVHVQLAQGNGISEEAYDNAFDANRYAPGQGEGFGEKALDPTNIGRDYGMRFRSMFGQ